MTVTTSRPRPLSNGLYNEHRLAVAMTKSMFWGYHDALQNLSYAYPKIREAPVYNPAFCTLQLAIRHQDQPDELKHIMHAIRTCEKSFAGISLAARYLKPSAEDLIMQKYRTTFRKMVRILAYHNQTSKETIIYYIANTKYPLFTPQKLKDKSFGLLIKISGQANAMNRLHEYYEKITNESGLRKSATHLEYTEILEEISNRYFLDLAELKNVSHVVWPKKIRCPKWQQAWDAIDSAR
jgi:hypothetical protein